jgi:ATP-dependent RNA helicase DDX10/DBP4
MDSSNNNLFSCLDLSANTKKGLRESHFLEMTKVQEKSISLIIKGYDTWITSPTGTGKTLAFMIPLLEILLANKWNRNDGLGALIITPTRELAIQIFDMLKKIGKHHLFSAGLIIGGKSFSFESNVIEKMNIIISTPGRLLQHLDQSHNLSTLNLKLLVIDEADKLLDLGFKKVMDSIIKTLPLNRQTVMLSATLGESLASFSRTCINYEKGYSLTLDSSDNFTICDISQVSPTKNLISMPQGLSQYVHICPLDQKINYLSNFLKVNRKSKVIVFLSSCKQVRYFYEVFRKLQPAISFLSLHGKQKQLARTKSFYGFCKKQYSVLFSTDISSRGLDFPSVDWVIHFDCPESLEVYIHRSGRTARYQSVGSSLLFLFPEEKEFLDLLCSKGYSLSTYSTKYKPVDTTSKIQQICSQHQEIKYLGQRAFITYIKSVYVNNSYFKLNDEDLRKFAISLGLMSIPRLRFLSSNEIKSETSKEKIFENT